MHKIKKQQIQHVNDYSTTHTHTLHNNKYGLEIWFN
jgi:hypothetical protein